MKKNALLFALLIPAGCNSTSSEKTVADPLQQSVVAYMQANANAFPGYEAVRWSKPTPFTKMNEAAIKGVIAMQAFDDALVPRNQALADYKASLARHDSPAQNEAIKARYGKANKHNDSLLVIANSFLGNKDSTRLGTQIVHTYRTKNKAGAVVLDSAAFVVYSNGKVEQL
jgi:hypothetical protein